MCCPVCLEAQKYLGTLVFFGSQTLLICYGPLKNRRWLLGGWSGQERCNLHVRRWQQTHLRLSAYKEEQRVASNDS